MWEDELRGLLANGFLASISAIWMCTVNPAVAQEMSFRVVTDRAGCGTCIWVQASGEIASTSATSLKSFLQANPFVSVLQIDSTGGNLGAALEMGELVRSRNLAVVVGGASLRRNSLGDQIATRVAGQCMSACVYVLAGGQPRSQVLDSVVGVHQFYGGTSGVSGEVALDTGQRVSGALIEYLTRMGVSASIITAASSARPDEIYILSNTEKLRFKLLTSVQEQYSAVPGYGRAVAAPTIDPFGDSSRLPPASVDECGKARYSLADAGSVSAMQAKNRFFRDVCNAYFEIIDVERRLNNRDIVDCQDAWGAALDELNEEGTLLPNELRLASLRVKMGGLANSRCGSYTPRQPLDDSTVRRRAIP